MKYIRIIAGVLAILFGFMTLKEGGTLLFGGPEALKEAGNVVPWVLYYNFTAGFVYLATGVLTLEDRPIAKRLALGLAVVNLLVLSSLIIYIFTGGLYMERTPVAMAFRTGFWMVQAGALRRVFPRFETGMTTSG